MYILSSLSKVICAFVKSDKWDPEPYKMATEFLYEIKLLGGRKALYQWTVVTGSPYLCPWGLHLQWQLLHLYFPVIFAPRQANKKVSVCVLHPKARTSARYPAALLKRNFQFCLSLKPGESLHPLHWRSVWTGESHPPCAVSQKWGLDD